MSVLEEQKPFIGNRRLEMAKRPNSRGPLSRDIDAERETGINSRYQLTVDRPEPEPIVPIRVFFER
ncbi:unnamed protein product, partial [Nesidiocoris tenuis]